MRKQDIEVFFGKKIASAFDDLFDLLPELYSSYKKDEKSVSWVQKSDLRLYGFKLLSKSKKYSLFVGLDWHVWSDLGYPISMYLDTNTGVIRVEDNSKFKKCCESIIGNESKYFNYDDYNVCGLSIDFLCQDFNTIKSKIYELFINLNLNNK